MARVNKENDKKGKKKIDNRKKKNEKESIKSYEKYTCFVVGFIILLLLFAVIKNIIFIPAFLITIGLELFCIAYYYMDNKNKKSLVYALFQMGVFLVVIAIIYTIFNLI